jgi:hypothetical protein
MGAPQHSAGGSSRIHYSFGFFDLAPGEALVLDADPVDARFFDVQLYSLGWFESLDFANRVTSLNHTQARRSDDGRVRAVITLDDPGVPNWLDTQGHQHGMVTFRWIRATEPPTITAALVTTDQLSTTLPPDTPSVTREQRADEIRRRQAHAAWRYRT